MPSNVVIYTHLILYSNTMRHMHTVLTLSVPNFNNYVSHLVASKFKVSPVFLFYFPAVYFGDINPLPFSQRFWLILSV